MTRVRNRGTSDHSSKTREAKRVAQGFGCFHVKTLEPVAVSVPHE